MSFRALSEAPSRIPALIILLFTLICGHAWAEDTAWELKQDKKGIAVSTRSVEGSAVKEFKGEMLVDNSLGAIVALLDNPEAGPEWIYNCESITRVETNSESQTTWNHVINKLPWPAGDRDLVVRSDMTQSPETYDVLIALKAEPELLPEVPGKVRIQKMKASWQLSPQKDGQVKVTYQAHIEPGGSLPNWLVNSLLVDTPYKSLSAMRELLSEDQYKTQSHPDIVEPNS
ncbi:START domain-containing protein [Parendozoicomonas haliclonae]|nr:START domain-containing protein [Parendozoicomonas haliclonae]